MNIFIVMKELRLTVIEPLYCDLFKKNTYSMNVDYIVSSLITEYDISKGNISIMRYLNIIDDALYWELYNAPKQERVVRVGLMMRENKEINKAVNDGFIEAKRLLFDANRIQEQEVQAIRNDAVYIINRKLQYTQFGPITFMEKNVYNEYFKIAKKDYYYFYDPITQLERLEVKGINDAVLPLHEKYMLDFIKAIMWSVQNEPIEEAIGMIQAFDEKYKNFELDSGYYRRFDSESKFQTRRMSKYNTFKLDYLLNEEEKVYLDISYNHQIIEGLYRICSSIYFSNRRKYNWK